MSGKHVNPAQSAQSDFLIAMTIERNPLQNKSQPTTKISRWQPILSALGLCNRAVITVFGFIFKTLVLIYFLFCITFLVLRYAILPNVGFYKNNIEHVLGQSLGRTVTIDQINASWDGLRPNLQLNQVALKDAQGRNALVLPRVNLTVSWLSVVMADVHLYHLALEAPELDLMRTVDGKIIIAGWQADPNAPSDGSGLDWLLSQRDIQIHNGIIHWTDLQRGAPLLTLKEVNIVMRNRWQHHQMMVTATPPAALSGAIDVRADFVTPAFGAKKSDFLEWKGQIYANVNHTDLAAWKTYLTYPIDVQQGVGAVRAWYHFDKAKIVDFTADLKLSDVKTVLRRDMQLLDLVQVSGRISAQEITSEQHSVLNINLLREWFNSKKILASHKANNPQQQPLPTSTQADSIAERLRVSGHQIAITNFSFQTRSGLLLPPTTLTEKYIPATPKKDEQLEFSAQFLDLNVLANVVEHFPLPADYLTILGRLEPAGQLSDFSLKLQGKLPELKHFEVSGHFANLSMQPQPEKLAKGNGFAMPAIPGFKNLSGQIVADEKKGKVTLASKQFALQLPAYFYEPEMAFDSFNVKANWQFTDSNQLLLNVDSLDLAQAPMKAHFSGSHLIPINPDKTKPLGMVDIKGTINHFDVTKIDQYLPLGMEKDLHTWLTQGLEGGQIDNVTVRIKGELSDFPFIKKGGFDTSIFNVTGTIIDGKINYLPGIFGKDGVDPFWPILSKINGKIVFDKDSMDITAHSAETQGLKVTEVHAKIPELLSHDATLQINGLVAGSAQDMLRYVAKSPVMEWIGNFTQDTQISGNAKLKLKLDLPLLQMLNAKVTGELQLANNDVLLIKDLPVISQANGKIDFNERGLTFNGLKGNFLGGAVNVVGGSQKDGAIKIKAEGTISAEGVRMAYPQPELTHLLSHIDGSAPYVATIVVNGAQPQIWVDSTLQGMALNLPAPAQKIAAANMPLHFELLPLVAPQSKLNSNKANQNNAPDLQEMTLSLAGNINARYVRQYDARQNSWNMIKGGIGVNAPAPEPESGLSAHFELDSLNISDLQKLLPDSVNKSTANSSAGLDISPYLVPDVIAANAHELIVMGKKLDQVVLGASHQNATWQANILSKQIAGYVTWDNAQNGLGKVTARLNSLIIPNTAANDVVELLQNKEALTAIPALDITADNFELFGTPLGTLELIANNLNDVNSTNGNAWHISKLRLINDDASLSAKGKWLNNLAANKVDIDSQTQLNFELELANSGKLLERFGYGNVIKDGKGKLTGEVNWASSPYALDIPTLNGKIRLDMQAGQFLKVEPGAAKLLAVLNLQALPRRLLLDFRDVFSEGFAFDGITGDATIKQGVANTDNLKMRSVTATILMSGKADIAHETQDLKVVVVPEVNAGAASVVYGIAVNPIIGLGTFLAQLFLREPLMNAFTFEYLISGSWQEPNVVKVNNAAPKPLETIKH